LGAKDLLVGVYEHDVKSSHMLKSGTFI